MLTRKVLSDLNIVMKCFHLFTRMMLPYLLHHIVTSSYTRMWHSTNVRYNPPNGTLTDLICQHYSTNHIYAHHDDAMPTVIVTLSYIHRYILPALVAPYPASRRGKAVPPTFVKELPENASPVDTGRDPTRFRRLGVGHAARELTPGWTVTPGRRLVRYCPVYVSWTARGVCQSLRGRIFLVPPTAEAIVSRTSCLWGENMKLDIVYFRPSIALPACTRSHLDSGVHRGPPSPAGLRASAGSQSFPKAMFHASRRPGYCRVIRRRALLP